jgi:hypothetical protein
MRLINTASRQMVEYSGSKIPPYAILSHTWEEEEVSFQDYGRQTAAMKKRKGYRKIDMACQVASGKKIEFVWVDTCCINKAISTELTEALNSMFTWYKNAVICLAYLSDLAPEDPAKGSSQTLQLSPCRWFTRGWTLQELIAPKEVEFYDRAWKMRGTKAELSQPLASLTLIDEDLLKGNTPLAHFSVAHRMMWASNRQTKYPEDKAYCLIGIFDISMPTIYGEGDKAFLRLQEEVSKSINDLSLFAWQSDEAHTTNNYRGILAKSPSEFSNAKALEPKNYAHGVDEEFTLTNKGLRINKKLLDAGNGDYMMSLNSCRTDTPQEHVGIFLKKYGPNLFVRLSPHRLANITSTLQTENVDSIYIARSFDPFVFSYLRQNRIHFRHGFKSKYYEAVRAMPRDSWDSLNQVFLHNGFVEFVGCVLFKPKDAIKGYECNCEPFLVVCGMKGSQMPWATLELCNNTTSLLDNKGNLDLMQASKLPNGQSNRLLEFKGENARASVKLSFTGRLHEVFHVDLTYKGFPGAASKVLST